MHTAGWPVDVVHPDGRMRPAYVGNSESAAAASPSLGSYEGGGASCSKDIPMVRREWAPDPLKLDIYELRAEQWDTTPVSL
jgi:hypothetical protein